MATSRRTHRTLLTAGGTLLALGLVSGCGSSTEDAEPEQRSFGPVGDRLTLTKDNGDLEVRPADVEKVEVTRRFAGWSMIGSAEASWELKGDELTLDTDCGPIGDCAVDYRVLVPKDVTLTIEGDNGDISASGFDTALKIGSDNGSVSVTDVSGRLTLDTDNGDLRGSGITSGRVEVGSDNGDADLTFVAAPDLLEVTTDNGDMKVGLPAAEYKVTTETDNGDAHIDVPRSTSSPHVITTRTENGDIRLNTTE